MMVGFFTFLCFFLNGEEKQSMAGGVYPRAAIRCDRVALGHDNVFLLLRR